MGRQTLPDRVLRARSAKHGRERLARDDSLRSAAREIKYPAIARPQALVHIPRGYMPAGLDTDRDSGQRKCSA